MVTSIHNTDRHDADESVSTADPQASHTGNNSRGQVSQQRGSSRTRADHMAIRPRGDPSALVVSNPGARRFAAAGLDIERTAAPQDEIELASNLSAPGRATERDRPHAHLTDEIVRAGRDYIAAEQRYQNAKQEPRNQSVLAGLEGDRNHCLQAFIRVATAQTYSDSQYPSEPLNPSAHIWTANVAASMLSNFLGFGLPVIVEMFCPADWQALAYSGALGASALAAPDLVALATRKMGGAPATFRMKMGRSAVAGSVKDVAGEFIPAALNVGIYASANVLLDTIHKIEDVKGALARSLVSGFIMSVLASTAVYYLAKNTLTRNNVSRVEQLPVRKNNHSLAGGVEYRRESPRADRVTMPNKARELVARTAGAVAGATTYFATDKYLSTSKISNPVFADFTNIVLGISSFLAFGIGARLIFTEFFNHPNKHSNTFGINENEILNDKIVSTSLNQFEALLNRVGDAIRDGAWGEDAQSLRQNALDVFLTKAFMPGNQHTATALGDDLRRIKEEFAESRPERKGEVTESVDDMIAESLTAAIRSLEEATQTSAQQGFIGPLVEEVRERLRTIQMLFLSQQFQIGHENRLNVHIVELGIELTPVFAALRRYDRAIASDGVIGKLVRYADEKMTRNLSSAITASEVAASFAGPVHGRVNVGDVMERIESRTRGIPEDRDRLAATVRHILDSKAFSKNAKPDFAGAKMLMLSNLVERALRETPRVAGEPVADEDRAAVRQQMGWFAKGRNPVEGRTAFITNFKAGHLSMDALQSELQRSDAAADGDLEMGGAYKEAIENFRDAMGSDFFAALAEEARDHRSQGADSADDKENEFHGVFNALWDDVQKIPSSQFPLTSRLLSLPHVVPEMPLYLMHAAHEHFGNYGNKITSLKYQLNYKDSNGVLVSRVMGIPSQIRNPSDTSKYYLVSTEPVYYRDQDPPMIQQLLEMDPVDRHRYQLCITGWDITDNKVTIDDQMDQKMVQGMYVTENGKFDTLVEGVGEITWKKRDGDLSNKKNAPGEPEIHSVSTRAQLDGAALRGLPTTIHNDGGTLRDKTAFRDDMLEEMKSSVDRARWRSNDILRRENGDDTPEVDPIHVYAHGGGGSRFATLDKNYTVDMDAFLSEKNYERAIFFDTAWDFVEINYLQMVYDLFMHAGIMKNSREDLQDFIKNYSVFAKEGSISDKAADLRDRNRAKLHFTSAKVAKGMALAAQKNFLDNMKTELFDPANHEALMKMMDEHGDLGNNPLYLFCKHYTRFVPGSDSLAVGVKEHGEDAYTLNVHGMYPIYMLFDGVTEACRRQLNDMKDASGNRRADVSPADFRLAQERYAKYGKIREHLTVKNYEDVFMRPSTVKRRRAYVAYLATKKKASWAATVQPTASLKVTELRPDPRPESERDEPVDHTDTAQMREIANRYIDAVRRRQREALDA